MVICAFHSFLFFFSLRQFVLLLFFITANLIIEENMLVYSRTLSLLLAEYNSHLFDTAVSHCQNRKSRRP
jgi:hypothetical protein